MCSIQRPRTGILNVSYTKFSRSVPFLVSLGCLSALVSTAPMQGQGVYPFPTPVPVAGPSQTQTVTVTMQQAGAASALQALTQGSPNLDYTLPGGGTCATGVAYSAGQTCTVAVTFQPKYPGQRHGAVVLTQSSGTAIGTEFLEGSATGSLSVLVPGVIDTVAGDANWIYSGDNVAATASAIFLPMGEVTDAAGNLYISDTNNNRVRRVDAGTGIITTVAGGPAQGYQGDNGPGTSAELSSPTALAIDGAGNLYIADSGNYAVRMLDTLSGIITTVAGGVSGSQGDGGPATSAHLSAVNGLVLDTLQNLFLADTGNNTIRKINLVTGIITRFAGTGTPGYSGDGLQAINATFNTPQGLALGADGSLYIADLNNNVVRNILPNGVVNTFAGGGQNGLGDGSQALQAALRLPAAVALDQAGNLYIADAGSNRIRKVNAVSGVIETVSGDGGEGMVGDGANADKAELYGPYSIYYDGRGNLFIGDMFHNRIREINGSTATFHYNPIRVDRTSPPQLEGLENDGNAGLNLAAPIFVNASLDSATTTCALPQTLAEATSCVLGVAFSPTVLGNSVPGSVTLNSDAGDSPAVVSLSGQVLSVDPTATTLTANPNPSALGAPVVFTAHVTTQGTSLSGSVKFLDGAAVLGSANLNAASTAAYTVSSLTLGLHTITAVYSGDATNATSTSPALIQSVKQPTTLALQTGVNPTLESAPLLLTATIAATGVPPAGSVTFADGGTVLGSGVLSAGGVATLSVSTLSIGQHGLRASYAGDANNSPSQSNTVQEVVSGQASSTIISTGNAVIPVGTSVTFSVQVTGSNTAIATGMVTFKDGAAALGTATLNASGAAGFSTATLTAGSHAISAIYQGDANYAASTAAPLVETVQQLATATLVSASANPAPAGATIVLTATVAATVSNPTGGPITGAVMFLNGGATLGAGALSPAGQATLNIGTIPLGQNAITAVYAGNTNYLASTSTPLVLTVQQAATATVLASSASPSTVEDAITLTATVTTNGGRATGIVSFSDGSTPLGQAALNAQGVATLVNTSLLVGQHSLVASYAGDTQNLASASPPITQTVLLHPTADLLTSSATSLSGGQQVTLISVVQWTGALVPTGTVTFQSAGVAMGASAIDSAGVATLTINPQPGLISVSATYTGDSVFSGSTSAPVQITLGTPPLFTMQASPSAMSLQRLTHSTVDLTVTSEQGFSDLLSLGCAGLPQAATCTFSADQMTLAPDGTSLVHVVIDTGSPLTAGSVAKIQHDETRPHAPMIALCGLPLGAMLCTLYWRVRRRPQFGGRLILLGAMATTAGLAGCGTLTINGTPAGIYHFQITAAARGAGVLEGVNMTLTVTP